MSQYDEMSTTNATCTYGIGTGMCCQKTGTHKLSERGGKLCQEHFDLLQKVKNEILLPPEQSSAR